MTPATLSPAMPHEIQPSRPRATRSIARKALRWLERGFALFGALVAVFWLTLDLSVMVSPSMSPTLQGTSAATGDRVLTEKLSYWFRQPRRWEVITFISPEGEKRMKRVAGLPGEIVRMPARGELSINDKPIEIPASLDNGYLRFGNLADGQSVPCDEGYFVLGDDLKDSDDSRFNGPVAADSVMGRAWLIVWPPERIGFVR